jgi:predicted dehydrogenase
MDANVSADGLPGETDRRVRLGLIGGAGGAFIGPVHAMAARLDGRFDIVAGAFSSDAGRSRAAASRYGVAPDRGYADFPALFSTEAQRADGIEAVSIVTPNHLHHSAAMAAIAAGLHVMCDKPLAVTLDEARELAATAQHSDAVFAVTYTYSGYPMVREARALIAAGALGVIRKIVVTYSQGWLAQAIERDGQKQADWRTDPHRSGPGGCIGDIGVHAFHLAEFVSGQRVSDLCADLSAMVPGRLLDDDCNMLLRFGNGARGVLVASQIATGEQNALSIRLYGDKAGLAWAQETPNELALTTIDGELRILRRGDAGLSIQANSAIRLPGGHPEGYIEAFATLYGDFHAAICGVGDPAVRAATSIDEAVRGIAFIDAAIRSGGVGTSFGSWVSL